MRIRVGCEFRYWSSVPAPTIWQVRPRDDGPHRLLSGSWEHTPYLSATCYRDGYGNLCDRLTLPEGRARVRYDALVEAPSDYDPADGEATQVALEALPGEVLEFLLPSRFCLSDVLRDVAWELFGSADPGWPRVQAVCDWVHGNVRFGYGSSTATTSALDVYETRTGVCRDFVHLAVTFCRALNIPSRYVSGYLPDIGVELRDLPMDFCAWFEAYLGGGWWTFDPRNNIPRVGRVVIGKGRDALDVAMVTSFGPAVLEEMTVWADEAA